MHGSVLPKQLLGVLLVIVQTSLFAQSPRTIDSLRTELGRKLPDSVQVMTRLQLAIEYENTDTAQSFQAYRKAIDQAREKELYYELGIIYQNLSFPYTARGRYGQVQKVLDSALLYLRRSEHPGRLQVEALVYQTMGGNYERLNNLPKSVEANLQALALFDQTGARTDAINGLLNLSTLYREMLEYNKEEEYIRKALSLARITEKRSDLFKSYSYLALCLLIQDRLDASSIYLDSARMYYAATESPHFRTAYHLVAGSVYMQLEKLDSAAGAFRESYALAVQNGDLFSRRQSELQLAHILTLRKEYADAGKALFALYDEVKQTGEYAHLGGCLQYISDNYAAAGDHKNALKYYRAFKTISDSLSSVVTKRYAAELEVQHETDRKNNLILQQYHSLRQKNVLNYSLAAAALMLLLVFLLTLRNQHNQRKMQQQRIRELEMEKQLAATEAVLEGEEKERSRLAKDLHDGLGGMLSGIKHSLTSIRGSSAATAENTQTLERSIDMLDSSIKEIRRVAHNMMPENLNKFGIDAALRDFCKDITASGILKVSYRSLALDQATISDMASLTVYRIVQELVSNSVKHAAATTALVQVSAANGRFSVTVEDDGRGFDPAVIGQTNGIGWSNIRNRVEFLKGKLDIESTPGKGTSVLIEFTA